MYRYLSKIKHDELVELINKSNSISPIEDKLVKLGIIDHVLKRKQEVKEYEINHKKSHVNIEKQVTMEDIFESNNKQEIRNMIKKILKRDPRMIYLKK